MAAHLTAKEAARLGLDMTAARPAPGGHRPRPTRDPYATRCTKCGATFDTLAAEGRHLEATGHRRYELVLKPITQ